VSDLLDRKARTAYITSISYPVPRALRTADGDPDQLGVEAKIS